MGIKVLVAGDYFPRRRVQEELNKNNFSFLDEVKPYTQEADYSIVNFEGCIADETDKPIEKDGPNLCCDKKAVEAIKKSGFNCLTLANNHFRDYGNSGVSKTINACKEYDLDYVGGGKNIEEAERILYKTIKVKTIAIINVCETEFSIAGDNSGGSAPLNPIKNYYAIQEAKKKADHILVIVHGGPEVYSFPTPRMKSTYRFFIDSGADAVVNHHQHCISGYESYHGKPIIYGLGNFCFDWVTASVRWWEEGYIVIIDFKDNGVGFEIAPYMQFSNEPKISFQLAQNDFYDRIDFLNKVIDDDTLLAKKFTEWCATNRDLSIFEPYKSRIARGLFSRKLLPSFLTEKRNRALLNMVRCESHREVLLALLNLNIKQ